jgi:aspartate/methionine/tyrosine aminotransferase
LAKTQMKIAPFETEHFFARYEFNTPYQLCNSDCESISIAELLELADGTLQEFGEQRLIYTESQGDPRLREAIASTYESVDPDEVVVLATPVEGIYLAAHALLESGDEVIVLSPAYDALVNTFEHVVGKGHVRKWAFRPAADQWRLDLDGLRGLLTSKTRLLVVNFPHNPTGYLPTPEWQQQLARIVEEHNLWLFSDEMYAGLVHPGTQTIPSAADIVRKSMVLSGLSKTHGLPGLRCGWLIIKDVALRENLINWKFYTSICAPGPSEFLAIKALSVWETLRDRSMSQIQHNLALAEAFFARWPDLFAWRKPQAGSTALVGYDVPSVEAVAKSLAEREGILIQPAGIIGGDDHHMRIGLGRAAFGEALARFEDWLKRG